MELDQVNKTVLLVDDEPNVLSSIRRQLGREFDILTATSGPEALEILANSDPVALVVSDMRMPGMSGAELLSQVAKDYPQTTRMILSGQADLESAIEAVNEGNIFRFVTKPAAASTLRSNFEAGLAQYHLVTTREELLEKTLHGLVEALNDILGLTNPVARQRTNRVTHYVNAIAESLQFTMPWELRLAALLSQIGCVNLPEQIWQKVYRSEKLSPEELSQYSEHPKLAAQLIRRIPQLEAVADMIEKQQRIDPSTISADFSTWDGDTTSTVILAAATTLDEAMAIGYGPAAAVDRLTSQLPGLPAVIVDALRAVHHRTSSMAIHYISPAALTLGMVVDQDVMTQAGKVLLERGGEVTRDHLDKLREECREPESTIGQPAAPLRVLIPA